MQRFQKQLFLVLILLLNGIVINSASAYGFVPQNSDQEACFASAMVGMDSVINSRLGVPPEHALELSEYINTETTASREFDNDLLTVILAAYLWKESPHSYAVNVFFECASKKRYQQQAKSE